MLSVVLCVVAVLAAQREEDPVEVEPYVIDNHVPKDYETFCEFLSGHEAATEILDLNNCNGEDRRRLAEEQFPDGHVESRSVRDEDTHFTGTTMTPPSMSGRRRMGDPAYAPVDDGLVTEAWYFYNSKPATKILVFDANWWYVYWDCWSAESCRQQAMTACGSHCTIASESGCTAHARGTRQQAMNYHFPSSFDHYHWVAAQDEHDRAIYMTCNGGFGWASGYGIWTNFMALYYCAWYNGWDYCEKVDRSEYVHAHHSPDNMENFSPTWRRHLALTSDEDENESSRRQLWMGLWNNEVMARGTYPPVERQETGRCEVYSGRWLLRYMARHHTYFLGNDEANVPSLEVMKHWQDKWAANANNLLSRALWETNARYVRENHWYWLNDVCHQWKVAPLEHDYVKDTGSPYVDEDGFIDMMKWLTANDVMQKLNDRYPISLTYKTRSNVLQGQMAHDVILVGYQHYDNKLQYLRLADSSSEQNGDTTWVQNGREVFGNWIPNWWEKRIISIRGRYFKQIVWDEEYENPCPAL